MEENKRPPLNTQPWCISHEHTIRNLEKEVWGNGREGLKTKVERIDTKQDTVVKLLKFQITTFILFASVAVSVFAIISAN